MKTFFELFLIITLYFFYADAELKGCVDGLECVLLAKCPAFLKNKRSNAAIRSSICGFHKKQFAKVCCAVSKVRTSDLSDSFSSKESLLPKPKKCGMAEAASLLRIHGGTPAPIGAYPWMAAIGYRDIRDQGEGKPKFECGGSLINSRYVLTAAHCIDERNLGPRKLSVIHLGDWDVSKDKDCQKILGKDKCAPPHLVAGVEEVIMHSQYNTEEFSSDIGLIRLNITINFEKTKSLVTPICLPPKNKDLEDITSGRKVMTAAGWGLTENRKLSDILMHVKLSLTKNEKCLEHYPNFKEESQLCIGGMDGDDTCAGDSGGPIFMPSKYAPPYVQIGIVAYGIDPCAIGDIPSVYTSVNEYRDWIVENLKP